jgi:hypothetical protein
MRFVSTKNHLETQITPLRFPAFPAVVLTKVDACPADLSRHSPATSGTTADALTIADACDCTLMAVRKHLPSQLGQCRHHQGGLAPFVIDFANEITSLSRRAGPTNSH